MTSLKTYLTLTALVFSLSAAADRSRDRGKHNYQGHHNQSVNKQYRNHQQDGYRNHKKHNKHNKYQSQQRKHGNQHQQRHNQYGHNNRGFNGDYRNNRQFDNSNRHHNSYNYNRNYNQYGYDNYNHYKPKKHYKKWKKHLKKHHNYFRNHNRYLYNYQVYDHDLYRYRPLRGLGHYFERPNYGYGHWHDGIWCVSYHDAGYYRDYYSYYPYQDGWRQGDGDFGIWFSFNL